MAIWFAIPSILVTIVTMSIFVERGDGVRPRSVQSYDLAALCAAATPYVLVCNGREYCMASGYPFEA
jgi:hypothetical protein